MKIPTSYLRQVQDPRSDVALPVLQQWWIEYSSPVDSTSINTECLLIILKAAMFTPWTKGEWVDVPTVYGESCDI